MSFAQYSDTISVGDTVMIYEGPRSVKPLTVASGAVFQNKYGHFRHDDMVGARFGSKMVCDRTRGFVHLLHPTPELWTVSLPHRTQILYGTDIATVVMELDLGPGSVVVESGTGSGSLTHALARTVAPTGHVHSFEFHEERARIARGELVAHGLDPYVTVTHADACEDGFGLADVADAVFLDLPKPWLAVEHAKRALRREVGGRICTFSPCIEQVQRTCTALREGGFVDLHTVSALQREYEVRSRSIPRANLSAPPTKVLRDLLPGYDATRVETHSTTATETKSLFADPVAQMPGHTGYLTFATLPAVMPSHASSS
eukprot:m.176067 g.176067  ORF g.176067 m.176067 type:complete len:316 (+) comp14104_c0_seq1:219-1166(+)